MRYCSDSQSMVRTPLLVNKDMTDEAQRTVGNTSFLCLTSLMLYKDHTLKTKQPHTSKGVINAYKLKLHQLGNREVKVES